MVRISRLTVGSSNIKGTWYEKSNSDNGSIQWDRASYFYRISNGRPSCLCIYERNREKKQRNARDLLNLAVIKSIDLHVLELDVSSQSSIDEAVSTIVKESNTIDVMIHNAGHMSFGPCEAFTPEQLSSLYDINVIGTQRMNRFVLPIMRKARQGLLLWVSSTSVRGGTPPFLGPYFAAKAAMDSLAVSYAGELSRWGIETSIVVPGAFITGTNHFANASNPLDIGCRQEYQDGPYRDIDERINGFPKKNSIRCKS